MRIGISGISLHGTSRRGGFWEYFNSLLEILSKVVQDEEIFVFIRKGVRNDFKKINHKNFYFIEIKIPAKGSHYTQSIFLPYYLKKYRINLLHFPTFSAPLSSKIPYIITVHDLSFLKFKKNLKKKDIFYWKYIFRLSLKRANFIISVSENTKKDLNENWRIPIKKIKVIPSFSRLLISEFHNVEKKEIERYGIKNPYYLFIGTLEPRKNLKRVIDAFLEVSQEIEEVILLIIGQKGWERSDLFRKIEEKKQKIIWLDDIASEELPAFYKNAIALLYPSLYEGFGLPILEAYKFKVPVITSNVSSLPEVAGKGAIFVNPENVEEIKMAMLRVYHDRNLRNRLLQAQEREIKIYDYKKIGEEILSIYKEVFLNSL